MPIHVGVELDRAVDQEKSLPCHVSGFRKRGYPVDLHCVHLVEDARSGSVHRWPVIGVIDFILVEFKIDWEPRCLSGSACDGSGLREILRRTAYSLNRSA